MQENVPARGYGWDAVEAPPAETAPANLRIECGYAASNNKTDIELPIFLNSCTSALANACCERSFRARRTPPSLLSRPAAFCKNQSPRIGGTTEPACQFQGLVTFRALGHQAGQLQRICGKLVPVKPAR